MKGKLLLGFVIGTGFGIGTGSFHLIEPANAGPQIVQKYNPSVTLAPLVQKMSPAVVNIEIEKERRNLTLRLEEKNQSLEDRLLNLLDKHEQLDI